MRKNPSINQLTGHSQSYRSTLDYVNISEFNFSQKCSLWISIWMSNVKWMAHQHLNIVNLNALNMCLKIIKHRWLGKFTPKMYVHNDGHGTNCIMEMAVKCAKKYQFESMIGLCLSLFRPARCCHLTAFHRTALDSLSQLQRQSTGRASTNS